jgi:hypothetical protein
VSGDFHYLFFCFCEPRTSSGIRWFFFFPLHILMFYSAVSSEDKAVIRSRLLESGIEEYDHRLALQNALVIAKVSRFEYPQDWYKVIRCLA